MNKKKIICVILVGIVCIAIIVSFNKYREWNKEGFYIDFNDVESIVYYSEKEKIVYTEILDNIISKYNKAKLVKKMDGQEKLNESLEYMLVKFRDGSEAIIVDKYIEFEDKAFSFEFTIEDLLKK